jgi:hypothetical protein
MVFDISSQYTSQQPANELPSESHEITADPQFHDATNRAAKHVRHVGRISPKTMLLTDR